MTIYCGVFEDRRRCSTSLVYWVFLGGFIYRSDLYNFGKRNPRKRIGVKRYFKWTRFTTRYLADETISKKVEMRLGFTFIRTESFKMLDEEFRVRIKLQIPHPSSEYWKLRKSMLDLL